jgi:ribosomal protein L14E/L6E/L27E
MAQDRTPLPNRQLTCWRNVIANTIARFGKTLHGVKAVGTGRQRKEYEYIVFNVGEKVIECTWHEDDNYIRLAVMHGIDENAPHPEDLDILGYVIRVLNERYLLFLPDAIEDVRCVSSNACEDIWTARVTFYKTERTASDEERLDEEFLTVERPEAFTRRMLTEQGIAREKALKISNRFMTAIAEDAAQAIEQKAKKQQHYTAQEEFLRAYKKFTFKHL